MKTIDELAKDLLASAFLNLEAKLTMLRLCQPEDFPKGSLRELFLEIGVLGFTEEHIDITVVADRCPQLGGLILELAGRMPNPQAAAYYAGRLVEERHRRDLKFGVAEMTDLLRDADIPMDRLESDLDRIWLRVRDERPRRENRLLNTADVELPESFQPLHFCGFRQWEAFSAGFCPELFHLLYGRAGIGKTTWMSQLAGEMAQRGASCLIVSLEVPVKRIKRMLVDQGYGDLSIWVWEHPSVHLATLKADIHYAVRAKAVTAVFVDNLAWITAPDAKRDGGRVGEIEEIMRELSVLGRDLQVSTLLVWHENKEGKVRYRCEGFPDSITRMESDNPHAPRPEVSLTVEKARYGREGSLAMRFNRLLRQFEEVPCGFGNGG